jgi:hypothetical protein
MAKQVQGSQWRKQNDPTKYPFAANAKLQNGSGRVIVEGTFLDAALYPIGDATGLFVTSVTVGFQTVTVTVGTEVAPALGTGTFDAIDPPDEVALVDTLGRPAGVLVSEGLRLGLFRSWGVGTHEFLPDETPFCGSCVFPTPEPGLRGITLETGELFIGDVWLIGDDGVVLRASEETRTAGDGTSRRVQVIRVDVVGDPLFRRRLCQPNNLFETPRFLREIRFVGPNMDFVCGPDDAGNVRLAVTNDLVSDTILRLNSTSTGVTVGVAGG